MGKEMRLPLYLFQKKQSNILGRSKERKHKPRILYVANNATNYEYERTKDPGWCGSTD